MTSSTGHGTAIVLACFLLLGALGVLLAAPPARAGTAVIFREDFESGIISARWNASDQNPASGLDYWGISNYRPHAGNYSAWCAEIGTQAGSGLNNTDVHEYDDNMQADLVLDLRVNGFTSLTLSFYYWSRTESGGGDFLEAWYVAGTTSALIFQNRGTANWAFASVAVPNNVEQLVIRFTSDAANHAFEGAYVDDIVLTGIENVPPTSSVSPLPAYTNRAPYPLPYTAADNLNASGIDYVELWWRMGGTGNFTLYSSPSNPLGRWNPWVSPTIPFDRTDAAGDGAYEFYTIAVDNASNAEAPPASADASMTVDTVAPTLAITEPAANVTTDVNSVTFNWTAQDATSGVDHFQVWLDGDSPTTTTNVRLTVTGIADGAHTFHVAAYDRAGNRAEATVSFTVHTNPYGWALWLALLAIIVAGLLILLFWWRRRKDEEPRGEPAAEEAEGPGPETEPETRDETGEPAPDTDTEEPE